MNTDLRQVREWIHTAGRMTILSGAGMSAESGVPTFRDAQTGLWASFDPQQLATEEGFRADPALVWDWYAFRRDMISKVEPNAGHRAIAAWQRTHPGRLTVITQNVDGLHQRAGSAGVLALHGNISEDEWLDTPRNCCRMDDAQAGRPPRCPGCGNMLRPGVVWFGEMLPVGVLDAAQEAARACGLMLVVGTAGVVYPAAGLAHVAGRAGAKIVILNTDSTELDDVAHVVLRGKAAELLPVLLA